jgi:hypothetical protein
VAQVWKAAMNTDWQSIIAISIAVLAGIWAMYMFLAPFIASLQPEKPGRCSGGCGCGHEEKSFEAGTGKIESCDSPLKQDYTLKL